MTEENKDKKLPVRTLHEFLFEISQEWDRFRTGGLFNMVLSGLIVIILIPRLIAFSFRRGDLIESLVTLGIMIACSYNIYISWRQHDFYKKWEKKIGLLIKLEEDLLGDEK